MNATWMCVCVFVAHRHTLRRFAEVTSDLKAADREQREEEKERRAAAREKAAKERARLKNKAKRAKKGAANTTRPTDEEALEEVVEALEELDDGGDEYVRVSVVVGKNIIRSVA